MDCVCQAPYANQTASANSPETTGKGGQDRLNRLHVYGTILHALLKRFANMRSPTITSFCSNAFREEFDKEEDSPARRVDLRYP